LLASNDLVAAHWADCRGGTLKWPWGSFFTTSVKKIVSETVADKNGMQHGLWATLTQQRGRVGCLLEQLPSAENGRCIQSMSRPSDETSCLTVYECFPDSIVPFVGPARTPSRHGDQSLFMHTAVQVRWTRQTSPLRFGLNTHFVRSCRFQRSQKRVNFNHLPRIPNSDDGAGAGAGGLLWWSLRAPALATPVGKQDLRYSSAERFRATKQGFITSMRYA
jgi:hypothetical protein